MNTGNERVAPADYEDYTEDLSFLKTLEIPLLIRILKEEATENQPMSAALISDRLSEITGLEHSEKTVLRKLQRLMNLQNKIDDSVLEKHLQLSLGGTMVEISNRKKGVKHVQNRYYFRPLLDKSDVDMVCGTITSNRYLSLKEKEYLIAREKTLCYGDRYVYDQDALPEKPRSLQNRMTDGVLRNVNILYDAIREKYQVDIVYGYYGENPKKYQCPTLLSKNENKPYHLNPYAMIWNDGEYYLLATHRGHTNVSHFRVDRIISVNPVFEEDDATRKRERENLPEALKPFVKRTKGKEEFLAEKYTAVYPLMAIFGEEDLCEAVVECKANAIGVVIDYFGKNLRIMPPKLDHPINDKDINGNTQSYVSICLPKAQYENVRGFCLLQHMIVTAVSPKRLVHDVKEGLRNSADKLIEDSAFL